jgi:hypothetical protein
MIQKGQKVHCILYGGRDGIVFNIHGEQRPETIKSLGGGICVMGGNADFDIAWDDGTISYRIPESIVHGVQWHVYEKVATEEEISKALAFAAETKKKETERKEREAREFEEEKKKLPALYPWLFPKEEAGELSEAALAAKNIKVELRRAFPGIKFSVKSSYFSGGSAVDVHWTGEKPTTKEVEEIISKYEQGNFDGMTDSYNYVESPWLEVFGHAKYCMAQRRDPTDY